MWNGGQASQAGWLNSRLKASESNYDFSQLVESGTVLTDKGGLVAVFTPEHAHDHATGANRGTMRKPNMRLRESLTRFQTAPLSPAPLNTHGGYPTPSSVNAPIPATRPPTMLQAALGELADGYRIAPDTIDKKDLDFLNSFLERIDNVRLQEYWRKKSERSGRKFIVVMLAEMEKSGSSLTAEETMETRMRLILTNGMQDATFSSYLDVVGNYEELNEVRANPIPERTRAHSYRKMVCDLGKDFEMKMLLRLSILESAAAALGEFPARDTPIEHVNEAAGIVLDDEMNAELIKSIESGRAFNAQRFDPARNQRTTPGGAAGGNAGQTWSYNGPEQYLDGMRNCVFCEGKHVDLKCPKATKAQKDALQKERSDKAKAKREAWRERSKGKSKSGGAALARPSPPPSTAAADDADEAMAKSRFSTGSSVLVDLGELMPQGGAGHSFMAKPSPLAASHSRASQAESVISAEVSDDLPVWVVAPEGDTLPDSISAGVYLGDWKTTVVPEIVRLHLADQLTLSKSELRKRTTKVSSLSAALSKCKALDMEPIFLGPVVLEGLSIGDDLADFLADSESEPSTDSDEGKTGTTSEEDPDSDSESEVPSSQAALDKLMSKVESFTVNTHVDVLRECIKSDRLMLNGAPVSPGTGGAVARRTKFQMLQEIRQSVGAPPLDSAALLDRHSRPDVPMGEPVAERPPRACKVVTKADLPVDAAHVHDAGKYDIFLDDDGRTFAVEKISKNAAKRAKRAAAVRNLDFTSPPPRQPSSRLGNAWSPSPTMALVLVAAVQLLVIGGSVAASGSYITSCRTVSPTWVCDSLGYVGVRPTDTPSTPSISVPTATVIGAIEPGARGGAEDDTPCGGVGSGSLLLPIMACLILISRSLATTASFVSARTPRIPWPRQANGFGKGGNLREPPRDTSHLSPRSFVRSQSLRRKRASSKTFASGSRFLSTVGEAPLWVSLLFLSHEIITRLLPSLIAIWLATTAVGLWRLAHDAFFAVLRSSALMPVRVTLRVATNIVAAVLYIVYTRADLSRWGG